MIVWIKYSRAWCAIALLALTLLVIKPSEAQDTLSPVITAETVTHLESVAHIDFEGTMIETGWFFTNHSGNRFVTHSAREIYVWNLDEDGTVSESAIFQTKGATLTSAAFAPDDTLYAVLQGQENRIVKIDTSLTPIRVLKGWSLMTLWADDDGLWAEAFSEDVNAEEVVLHIPYDSTQEITVLPYAPASDLDAVVRIGRIAPPYTVTSTEQGRVTVWNLGTGDRLHDVETGVGQAAVFGAMNVSATHLIWRDQASEGLYGLDLETGDNTLIAPLEGDYIQWLFLTPDADVIFGIDKEFSQHITAWLIDGTMLDLGPYRACERPQPDMSMLSGDGTTLVIGCDTGIDIWRVTP